MSNDLIELGLAEQLTPMDLEQVSGGSVPCCVHIVIWTIGGPVDLYAPDPE